MARDEGKQEEKFDFTREGESLGYISLDQARVLAMRTARETPGDYGRRFRSANMAFEVVEDTETEDHYVVTLSFRPEGVFAGTPGREQFFIQKEGTVAVRQVLGFPTSGGMRRYLLNPVTIGAVVVAAAAVIGVVLATGGGGDGEGFLAAVPPISTSDIVPSPVPPTATAIPLAALNPALTPAPIVGATATAAPTATAVATLTTIATSIPATTPAPIVGATATAAPTATAVATLTTIATSIPATTPAPTSTPEPAPVSTRPLTLTPTTAPKAPPKQTVVSSGGLIRGAAISGRVTDVDTGLAIANVRMRADDPGTGKGPRADTGPDGTYTIGGLAAGVYVVSADGVSSGYITELFDDTYKKEDASRFAITGIEVLKGIDFGLKRGATISGRVIDSVTGLPIAKMDVTAIPADGDDIFGEKTDMFGRYTLKGMPDGVVEVVVGGQGYIQTSRTVTLRDGQDVTDFDF